MNDADVNRRQRLKSIRLELGLNADDLAQLVGIEHRYGGRTVRRWEAGERAIPNTVMLLLDLIEQVPGVRQTLLERLAAHHAREPERAGGPRLEDEDD